MKLFIICSKNCYKIIQPIVTELEELGHEISYPNCFDNPQEEYLHISNDEFHRKWKSNMFRSSVEHIANNDAVLVLNLNTDYRPEGYIGGATMLEMYEAFRQDKKVFVYNPLPDRFYSSYRDELNGLVTKIIYGDLTEIK